MAESIDLKDLDISLEESRDIIKFSGRKRNVSNYESMTNKELLSTLKKTPQKQLKLGKRKNTQIITTQKLLKIAKLETNQNLTLQTQNLTPQKSLKSGKHKNTQSLTYEKPSKLTKRKNLTLQKRLKTKKQEKSKNNQQQIISENKKRIRIIREELKELSYKLSKSES